MVAELIGVGKDYLYGNSMDESFQFFAGELAALGIDLNFESTVGDSKPRLQKSAAHALERSDILIVLGGIGSGENDITKEVLVEGISGMLTPHQESLNRIKEFYRKRGQEMPLECVKEAMLPDGAHVFANSVGTSPGCAISAGRQTILMLPSNPDELVPMLLSGAYHYLAGFSSMAITMRDFYVTGKAPDEVAAELQDLLSGSNPVVALYPRGGELLVRVTARAKTQGQSAKLCAPIAKEIKSRLGRSVRSATSAEVAATQVSSIASSSPAPPKKLKWWQRIFPTRGDDGRDIARKSILILSSLVLMSSLGYIGWEFYQSSANQSLVDSMEGMLGEVINRPEGYPGDYLAKFVPWWEINQDVAGRIEITGTPLKYAIVQAKDNDFYLRRNFYKKDDKHGVPYIDFRVNQKKESTNTIIYGHNMKDGQIFGELMNYKGLDYYKKHPVIKYDSVYREGEYKIISVFVTNIYERDGAVWPYHDFIDGDAAAFDNYVQQAVARSLINTTVDVKPGDKLLTLSTCSYEFKDARTVVVARKVREGESAKVDTDGAKMNPNPVMPGAYWAPSSSAPPVSSSSAATSREEESSEDESSEESSEEEPSEEESSSMSSEESSSKPGSSKPDSSSSASSSKPPRPSSSSEEEPSEEESSEDERIEEESSEEEPSSSSEDSREEEEPPPENANAPIAQSDTVSVDGNSMEAFDAVCGIVMNETGGTYQPEAIKAQAVAVYSRLVARNGFVSGMGTRTPSSTVKSAVREVWGQTVQSGSKTVDTYFYSTSAGMTNTAKEVWGGSLVGHNDNVDSHWDESSRYYGFETRMSKDTVIDKVYDKMDVDLSTVPEEEWFEVKTTTGGGYNEKMTVGGQKSTNGRYLRESVLGLKSACFEWDFSGNDVIFTTYGYGHGVGMSQNGANEMAKEGSSYKEILEHYYPGCRVR